MCVKQGHSPDEARLEQTVVGCGMGMGFAANPIPIPHPTNLALFGHKITLFRFNQRGSYYGRGAQTGAGGGAPPLAPVTLTTGHGVRRFGCVYSGPEKVLEPGRVKGQYDRPVSDPVYTAR